MWRTSRAIQRWAPQGNGSKSGNSSAKVRSIGSRMCRTPVSTEPQLSTPRRAFLSSTGAIRWTYGESAGAWKRVPEQVELGRVAVAVEEQHVVGVDGPHGLFEAAVEGTDDLPGGVARLVDRVVPGDPTVALVPVGKGLPEVHDAVLEVSVGPEVRPVGRVVAVPVLVLR